MPMLQFRPGKAGLALLLTAIIILFTAAAACASTLPPSAPAGIDKTQPPGGSAQAPAVPPPVQAPAPVPSQEEPAPPAVTTQGSAVQIKLIHYRGTLTRIGCCNPGLYEKDEFVVIQNTGDTYQDITDWRLTNITRGYPTLIFPSHFACVPYNLPVLAATEERSIAESYYTITKNPAQSEVNRFSTDTQQSKPANVPNSDVKWSSCTPLEPLDETPMKPASGQQGLPLPCILYPGQTCLLYTSDAADE